MSEIFGFTIDRKNKKPVEAFAPKELDDGALVVATGGAYGTYIDLDGAVQSDAELITKYREMALFPDVETAIDDIVNEVITNDPDEPTVKIVLDNLDQPDNIKKLIETEFDNILQLLEFSHRGYEIFKTWYVDGRIYYHMIIDSDAPHEGIKEMRYIDARKIRKIRETTARRAKKSLEVATKETAAEYYMYSEKGFASATKKAPVQNPIDAKGIKIAKDSIDYITSGLMKDNLVLSHLHKAIRPLNQLKSMEDSLVIYRIARAPERRVFYIDVGTLPPAKAEQHLKNMMTKFKNRLVYDASTGEVRDDRKHMSMLEDFWLARRGERGTEVETLPGGQNLGSMEDVDYFLKKLYKSLNVPTGRLQSDSAFDVGRPSEISRDELKFQKFISRLRLRFQELFTIALGKQLVLKSIVTEDEWKDFASKIAYRFSQDNATSELKESEIMNDRMALLQQVDLFAGKYFSHEWIRKNILRQTDQDIEDIDKQIDDEMQDPKYMTSYQPQFNAADKEQNQEDQAANQEQQQQQDDAKDKADKEHELKLAKLKQAKK